MSTGRKAFLLPHIYVSYFAEKYCKQDNLEYIIVSEIPENIECENV